LQDLLNNDATQSIRDLAGQSIDNPKKAKGHGQNPKNRPLDSAYNGREKHCRQAEHVRVASCTSQTQVISLANTNRG